MINNDNNITVGRYLISPITKALENGWYACAVSIRSGADSARHDRVLRLTRLFRCQVGAVRHATGEALQWIAQRDSSTRGIAAAAL